MLHDQELRQIAGGLAEAKLAERRELFDRETERMIGTAVSGGRLKSGFLAQDLVQHYSAEAQRRARDIWAVLHRVVTTTGLDRDEDLSLALRGFVVENFSAEIEKLTSDLKSRLDGYTDVDSLLKEFGVATMRATHEIRWEIELFLRSLSPAEGPVTQHIY